jgi:hypothetical protein
MLEYACELWDGCSQQDSDNLEKLQLEAGRIVTGLPLFASRQSIHSETGWELLFDRNVSYFPFMSIKNVFCVLREGYYAIIWLIVRICVFIKD